MTKDEFSSFRSAIIQLCQTYGVLIRRNSERRDSPKQDAVYFYEIELWAKITPAEENIMESRKKFQ